MSSTLATALVVPFEELRMSDVDTVGGKNSSLGEMISQLAASGVRVPGGFATTAHAFRRFLAHQGLADRIAQRLVDAQYRRCALARRCRRRRSAAGSSTRRFRRTSRRRSVAAFETLSADDPRRSFAVRSSATAEDLPDASFAGQQETFLNVVGIDDVLAKMKEVFASLYNDRAISYRVHKGFTHADVALVGRRAAHGALRPRRGRRDVHDRYRERLQGRRLHHLELRTRRDGGAGRGQPRRVLCAQAGAEGRQAGDHPAQSRLQDDPDGVRNGAGEGAVRAAWCAPSTPHPSSATAFRSAIQT